MNLSDLFIAVQIAVSSSSPAPLEEVYSNRESDGQRYYYAAADKELGRDSKNSSLIDGNRFRLSFEVSVNEESAFVEFANSEVQDYANTNGDTFDLLKPMVMDKTPGEVMNLYKSSGMTGVLLPYEFTNTTGSWVEFMTYPEGQESSMVLTYKEISKDHVKEIIAIAKGDGYRVADVYEHWQALIEKYGSGALGN